ncbi:type I inositol-1, 4, 5-triphosphate 5-phosphatase cvp2 [Klebsormidium nitens]|uniref:Type I inositol-1, 4, 5-triphosphate 5-phosphatase cvp2 n=1 Tax=Klebsormidium nitens TaxID=105231 RepID=A0A1Y1I0W2_KLENI|nr:type I inositol-1, 4, 5-triphosphate 5-phosphatase cvp2 [Klebsormidium nitens]|eukprot:GAQ84564.1 type I inositol-1, 4, 5-triphosphate 5-phosphatase cvp2 [Klebsormidium nitens]
MRVSLRKPHIAGITVLKPIEHQGNRWPKRQARMFAATQEIFRAQQYLRKWVGKAAPQAGSNDSPSSRGALGSPKKEGTTSPTSAEAQSRWDNDQEEESPRTLLRRKVIRGELRELRSEFTDTLDLSIHVATWNVNGRRPPDGLELDELLDVENPADIYVVGFQEIVPLNANSVLIGDMGEAAARWEALIHETLVAYPADKESGGMEAQKNADEKLRGQEPGGDLPEGGPDSEAADDAQRGDDERGVENEEKKGGGAKAGAEISRGEDGRGNDAAERSSGGLPNGGSETGGTESAVGTGPEADGTSVDSTDLIETLEADWHADASAKEKLDRVEGERDLRAANGATRRYVQVASKQMVGVHVCVWVRKEIRKHVRSVQTSAVGVGLLGVLGNKGSVSVSLLLHESTLCFVCSHLTSGDAEGDESRRSGDVSEITRRTYFTRSLAEQQQNLPATIGEHDQRIWLGDLNYRIALPDEEVREAVKKQDWETLVESDQLRLEQNAKQVFVDWQEGKIDFAPTYKYCPGTDRYVGTDPIAEGEKRRTPAWCDRVLWKGDYLTQLKYGRAELRTGDHRPVKARFATKADVIVPEKLEALLAKLRAKADADEMNSRPVCSLSPQIVHLGDIRYGVPTPPQPLQIHNNGAVRAEFAFVDVGGSGPPCPPWLTVTPLKGEVAAGEVLEVSVSARVDSASVDVEAVIERENALEGILVLRVHGGGDHFVSVTGNYLPSSWGLRLTKLAAFSEPVRGLTRVDLGRVGDNDGEVKNAVTGQVSKEVAMGQTVPKEVIRLLDHLMQPEQAGGADSMATKDGDAAKGRSPENGEEAEDPEAAQAAVRESLDTGADFPPGTSGRTALAALFSFLAALPEPLLSKSILTAIEADFATAKREAVVLVEQGLVPSHYGMYELLMTSFAELLNRGAEKGLSSQALASELADVIFGRSGVKEDKRRKQRVQFVKQLLDDRTNL